MPILDSLLNNPVSVSILVILTSSLVAFYVNSRVRDRCLRGFDGYRITLEDKAGKIVWGTLRVYSSGIELAYVSSHQDREGHIENSYILYDSEIKNLQAIYRFHHEQSERNQQRRAKDIQRTYQPSIFRRAVRALRNLLSTFKDAIVQATNAVLGQRATQSPQNVMLSKYKELTTSGAELLSGVTGNAYEPILERYIGQYVVAEIVRKGTVEEEYGILKEYSAKYLELLNVRIEVPLQVYLKDLHTPSKPSIPVDQTERIICVTNSLSHTLLVQAIRCDERVREVDVSIPAQEHTEIELAEDEMNKPVELQLAVRCLADLVLPRAHALVRHAGKREALSLDALLGLDDLPLPWVKHMFDGERTEAGILSRLIGNSNPRG